MLSHLATQRTSELGIRMALGGQRGQLLQLMLMDGLRPALFGLGLGLVMSSRRESRYAFSRSRISRWSTTAAHRRFLLFLRFDETTVKPDPPVKIILVIDIANLPFRQVFFVLPEVAKFLRQRGGHLSQQVSINLFSIAESRKPPQPSTNGNGSRGTDGGDVE